MLIRPAWLGADNETFVADETGFRLPLGFRHPTCGYVDVLVMFQRL